jgi:hypothetical protein
MSSPGFYVLGAILRRAGNHTPNCLTTDVDAFFGSEFFLAEG